MVLDVVKALGRRWYVVVVGLILSVGLAMSAYSITPAEYNARGLLLLLPVEVRVVDDPARRAYRVDLDEVGTKRRSCLCVELKRSIGDRAADRRPLPEWS